MLLPIQILLKSCLNWKHNNCIVAANVHILNPLIRSRKSSLERSTTWKKEPNWKHIWTCNGKIFLEHDWKNTSFLLNCVDDLFNLNLNVELALPTIFFYQSTRASYSGISNISHISDHYFVKEIKNAPSALLSYISTRAFLRIREKCGEARVEIRASRIKIYNTFDRWP